MQKLHGLIFDLDGTLVDSAADLHQALNALLSSYGRRTLTIAQVKEMVGDGLQTLLVRACAATGEKMPERGSQEMFQDFLKLYQNQKASVGMLYPHVIETLTMFRAQGVKIGLCTNKLYLPTVKVLDDIGIRQYFDFIAGSDTFSVYKPHPGHVMGVVRGLNLLHHNCVMIGDSPNDIRSARGAEVLSIAVSHGYTQDVALLGADETISGFEELPQKLRGLGFDFGG
jgi:phosphoglycolate phosphatase